MNFRFHLRKQLNTLFMMIMMWRIRTFGKFVHGGWDGNMDYVRYTWKGLDWIIPTGPCDD